MKPLCACRWTMPLLPGRFHNAHALTTLQAVLAPGENNPSQLESRDG
jgi:hypothetical protein